MLCNLSLLDKLVTCIAWPYITLLRFLNLDTFFHARYAHSRSIHMAANIGIMEEEEVILWNFHPTPAQLALLFNSAGRKNTSRFNHNTIQKLTSVGVFVIFWSTVQLLLTALSIIFFLLICYSICSKICFSQLIIVIFNSLFLCPCLCIQRVLHIRIVLQFCKEIAENQCF